MEKKTMISEDGTIRLTVDEVNPMERRIIENNNIPKLVPMTLQQIDDWVTIRYDVAGKTSLEELLKSSGSLTVEMGIHILKNLLQEIKRLEEYMLLATHMILEPEYIYIVQPSQKVEFLYVPYAKADTKEPIEDTVKAILAFVYQGIHMYPQNMVRDIWELLNSRDFTLAKLQEVLDGHTSARNVEPYIPEMPVRSMKSEEAPILTQKEEKEKKEKRKRRKEKERKEKKPIKKNNTDEKKLKKNRQIVVFLAVMAMIIVIDISNSVEISVGAGLILAMIVVIIWRRMGKHAEHQNLGTNKKIAADSNYQKETNIERANIDVFGAEIQSVGKKPVAKQPSNKTLLTPKQQGIQTPPQQVTPLFSSVLDSTPKSNHEIILEGVKTQRPIMFRIGEDEFVIGQKAELVDGVIDFNRTVSRRHCKVSFKAGQYYVEDLNSSNGTYLNGAGIESGKAAAIKIGDYIRIANMDFIVKGSER